MFNKNWIRFLSLLSVLNQMTKRIDLRKFSVFGVYPCQWVKLLNLWFIEVCEYYSMGDAHCFLCNIKY